MKPIKSGLVSVTFRALPPLEILDLVSAAGLEAIEWGGDIHVPVGEYALAAAIGRQTRARGLAIPTYGSYYRAGLDQIGSAAAKPQNRDFRPILATAEALGAANIRVWANQVGSAAASEEVWLRTAEDLARICEQAGRAGLTVSLEYHNRTLNDRPEATARLMRAIQPAWPLKTLWQPLNELSESENLSSLEAARPYLTHVHVFSTQGANELLAAAEAAWRRYLPRLVPDPRQDSRQAGQTAEPVDRCFLLEFVQNETRAAFRADAATLKSWLDDWRR